ncbi:peptidylprolyl isomerase [Microbulbifer hainanensis]|uniref:peptidylprolyl isomerase n=1 Tax=Microbulbifer hainanensis TaxID=2735675 RepID=UPI0018672E97|nr:peptidylprolyl isomerase [Microbulbifer hainanensis]
MKRITPVLALTLVALPLCAAAAPQSPAKVRPPAQIIAEAPATDWRRADPDNTLYIDTPRGRVIVELAAAFAPKHVANIKALAREHFYDGLSFYRVVDGFVAQGGDESGEKPIEHGARALPAEFTHKQLFDGTFTPLPDRDGYAPQTGFVHGFPAARDPNAGISWLTHCPAAFAMARELDVDSGGTEFYIVIGNAQRYLDRNTTVFGRVLDGMAALQKLQRGNEAMGMLKHPEENQITRIQVAGDLPAEERTPLEVLKTDSDSFKELIAARRHRPESWFVARPDYIDVCSVGVPTRQIPTE